MEKKAVIWIMKTECANVICRPQFEHSALENIEMDIRLIVGIFSPQTAQFALSRTSETMDINAPYP